MVNSKQLLDRLNKQYKPENGRLQEAVGESLINHASMAMVEENKLATAIAENPDLGTGTATDSKALRDIIRPRVTAGKIFQVQMWIGRAF